MIAWTLHGLARISLRALPPGRAFEVVRAVARLLPAIERDEAAAVMADELAGSGTCLSRAIAVASRVRGGSVAIGVSHRPPAPFRAHAWVLRMGRPVRESDRYGDVIAVIRAKDEG
jgi:hypothetical protein